MSTHAHSANRPTRRAAAWPIELVAGLVVAVVTLLLANVLLHKAGDRGSFPSFVVLAALCCLIAWALATRLLPLAQDADCGPASTRALVVALVGLATLIVYWTAFPIVLGAGAIAAGRAIEARHDRPVVGADARAVIAVGAFAAGGAIAIFLIDFLV